jgi:hypothetical protein
LSNDEKYALLKKYQFVAIEVQISLAERTYTNFCPVVYSVTYLYKAVTELGLAVN